MHPADLLGIPLLLALGGATLLAGLRYARQADSALQQKNRAALGRLFGPRRARGQLPPADGRWHRVLRETHRRDSAGAGRPWLVSEFWLVDSEGRQWHVVLRCDPRSDPQPRLVPLTLAPA
ncbi:MULTISPECIES: hypothetical protein [Ramlibacter]|uniref:DUF3301 domain-containing protein n=1 Tax=Ramlibacter pinisoli TaxID=2682844 RepID=A0A6N8J198_9BURK|nr:MULTISPECIES: hypothetical protein [Ramlibacter]MBA2962650.1 hypothetical protein [Ramlibacter sp. CGMCC 1.13660]MVQ32592.1 hypothetical protein [Ramlibacter pinisoli]